MEKAIVPVSEKIHIEKYIEPFDQDCNASLPENDSFVGKQYMDTPNSFFMPSCLYRKSQESGFSLHTSSTTTTAYRVVPPAAADLITMISDLPSNGIKFNDVVQIIESDNRVTTRFMNPDGGISQADAVYDDDSNSFQLGNNDDNEMSFLDALEDELDFNDDNGFDLLQSQRFDTSINMIDSNFMTSTNLDTSFTLGDIMQQQSISSFQGSGQINTSMNMSHAAEQSSRHLIVAAFPKTGAAYVIVSKGNGYCVSAIRSQANVFSFFLRLKENDDSIPSYKCCKGSGCDCR